MTHLAHLNPGTKNWKLTLAYDGSDFRGWQVQPGQQTIQGELQSALGRVTGESPLPQGSGRTDGGVHALGQVASFALAATIPPANLLTALNRTLPESIRILEAILVPDEFHARHSAAAKTYEYRVMPTEPGARQTCPPFLARYVYAYSWPLKFAELERAANAFVGTHDFSSFAATDPDLSTRSAAGSVLGDHPIQGGTRSPMRTIFSSTWEEKVNEAGSLLIYRVRGSGFLHHMVRNLVGTMLDVGRGRLLAKDIGRILLAQSRAAAGPTAPSRGLFLHSVDYE